MKTSNFEWPETEGSLHHDDNLYDVAVFSPLILNAKGKIEVEVNWDNIIKKKGVRLINNLNLENL